MLAKSITVDTTRVQDLQQTLTALEAERDRLVAAILATSSSSETDSRLVRVEHRADKPILELQSASDTVQSRSSANATVQPPALGETTSTRLGHVQPAKLSAYETMCSEVASDQHEELVSQVTQSNEDRITSVEEELRSEHILIDESTAKTAQKNQALRLAKVICQRQIESLTRYNEMKDMATGLIGIIAEARQERIIDVMHTFDADAQD